MPRRSSERLRRSISRGRDLIPTASSIPAASAAGGRGSTGVMARRRSIRSRAANIRPEVIPRHLAIPIVRDLSGPPLPAEGATRQLAPNPVISARRSHELPCGRSLDPATQSVRYAYGRPVDTHQSRTRLDRSPLSTVTSQIRRAGQLCAMSAHRVQLK